MDSALQLLNVFSDGGTSDASVDLNSHELSDLLDHIGDLLGELSSGRDHEGLGLN